MLSIPPPESRAVYEIMWRDTLEGEGQQITIQYGACALHPGQLRLQTHDQNMQHFCNTMATVVKRTHNDVTFIRTLPVLIYFLLLLARRLDGKGKHKLIFCPQFV